MTIDILNIATAAAAADDQTAETKRPARELPRAGVALMRLRSYIEFGVFKAKTAGYKDKREALLEFELLHPDHIVSGTKGDGTPFSFPGRLSVRVSIAGPTSHFGKLFAKMNYAGTATHMSQFVGKPFLGTLFHSECGKYVNLDKDREFHIGAPTQVDALSNSVTEIPVPELQGTPQLFLWENSGTSDEQIKAMWDSVFIATEGKNWIQEKIRSNLDFNGSRTQGVVDSGSATLDTSIADSPATVVDLPTSAAPTEAPQTESSTESPLAAIGLA